MNGLTQLGSAFENSTVGRESTLDSAMTNANNSYSTAATEKWSTFANSLAQAEKTYLNAVAAATGTNAATAITAAQKVRNDARSLALKDFQTGLLDSGVILNSAITGAIHTFVTGQSAAAAQESQGEATAQKTHNQADTTAEIGLTSALVTAGNAAATALSGASGAFSVATSGAQSAWKIAAALANGDHNPDGATRVFNDKLAELFADQQATNNPVMAAAGFISRMVTSVANAESAAATASGNALTTAVNTIGTADVTAVTTTTNADSAYSTASVGNDKTYLDGMATAEANYLRVVAAKWHEFRTGAITAAQRDEAIATSWTEFQTAAAQNRNTFRNDQAEDAATFRNTVAGAAKTHVDAVTAAQETLTNSLQNGQKTLTQQKADARLAASKGLVNLDTESTIQRAQRLAAAINQLATEDWETTTEAFPRNPFWNALALKADQSAEYIADTKNAERLYYGRAPWSDIVNGAVIDHPFGTRGVLDARRDFEVGMADAAATQNKALQHAVGERDRELADAGFQLAQARSTYETSWANLNLESSGWKLDQPGLPITGAVDGTISLTAGVGTTFIPGWFSVPSPSSSYSYSSSYSPNPPATSTGFNSRDLNHYFTSGLMPDMPDTDPVTTGRISRDDSRFGAALIQLAAQDGNETVTPAPQDDQISVVADADAAYEPPTPWKVPTLAELDPAFAATFSGPLLGLTADDVIAINRLRTPAVPLTLPPLTVLPVTGADDFLDHGSLPLVLQEPEEMSPEIDALLRERVRLYGELEAASRKWLGKVWQRFTTYNITVEEDHTYFVGNFGIWVHNTGEACEMLARQFYQDLASGVDVKDGFRSLVDAMRKQWINVSPGELAKHIQDVAKELRIDVTEAERLLRGSDEVANLIDDPANLRGISTTRRAVDSGQVSACSHG